MSLKEHRNKNLRRPVKSAPEKARRQKVQRTRLVKLGLSEEKVSTLNAREVRLLLRKPAKLAPKKAAVA